MLVQNEENLQVSWRSSSIQTAAGGHKHTLQKHGTSQTYLLPQLWSLLREQLYADSIQKLFDKIHDHNKEAAIKPYQRDFNSPDLVFGTTIQLKCFTWNSFKNYFYDVWDTMTGRNNKPYQVHGKLKLESELEYDKLKGRMLHWMTEKKHYLRNPIVQAAEVTKYGLLLGNSTAQHCMEVQWQLENAVKEATGQFVKIEVLTKVDKYRDESNRPEKTPILSIQIKQQHSEDAKEGLR